MSYIKQFILDNVSFYSPWLHLRLLQCSLLILAFTIVTLYQKQNQKAEVDAFALLAFFEYFIKKYIATSDDIFSGLLFFPYF